MTTNFQNNGVPIENTLISRELFSQGGLWAVGRGAFGTMGNNSTASQSSPVQTVAGGSNWKLVAGAYYSAAGIKTDGTLWLWGGGDYGVLGDGTRTGKSSPVQTISSGTNWRFISGGRTNFGAIKTDGSLWTWGYNIFGQLGDNTVAHKSSPVQTVAGGNSWKTVCVNSFSTYGIKTDGTLWCWGSNNNGQLGDNTTTNRSSPVQTIAGGTNWKQVSCANYSAAFIKTDGTLWTVGKNDYGQLGDGQPYTQSSPVQTVASGNNWKLVAVGKYTTAAIKTDGTLWTWGYNQFGQLGDNDPDTVTNYVKSSPVQTVAGGTNWKSVVAENDGYSLAAIKTDGTLWGWGRNAYGQLGTNDRTDRSSPTQVVGGGTNWKQVVGAMGAYLSITDAD